MTTLQKNYVPLEPSEVDLESTLQEFNQDHPDAHFSIAEACVSSDLVMTIVSAYMERAEIVELFEEKGIPVVRDEVGNVLAHDAASRMIVEAMGMLPGSDSMF